MTELTLEDFLACAQERVERRLSDYLPPETQNPQRLHEAMRYSTLGGGKRLRAALVYATGQAFGAGMASLDCPAAAVECIHSYSLIHDDLPCMDDDDLRRGKPSCHKAYDEATAVLAGDGLQALAFELLATSRLELGLKMVQVLAQCSGAPGMVGGQMADLLAEGQDLELQALESMHAAKTGALMSASVLLGALAAGHDSPGLMTQLNEFGRYLGLAFQIHDDVLDATADTSVLGKNAGQDAAHDKSTYVQLLGVEGAREKAQQCIILAQERLRPLSQNTDILMALSTYATKRLY